VTFAVTIENLKAHVVAFIQAEGIELEGGAHKCLAKFAAFVRRASRPSRTPSIC